MCGFDICCFKAAAFITKRNCEASFVYIILYNGHKILLWVAVVVVVSVLEITIGFKGQLLKNWDSPHPYFISLTLRNYKAFNNKD